MEAGAILNMVEDAFRNFCFIIDHILRNNDSTMQSVLKNPSRGAQGQVLKSYKGKTDEEILVPSFLTYHSHRLKVVSKYIFSIVKDGKAHRCGFTIADSLRIKRDWGYMIKNNRNKSLDKFLQASNFPL